MSAQRHPKPFQILSLSGGGYRGLFTVHVLREFEQHTGRSIDSCFDLIAGTSVGGLLALALSLGKTATELAAVVERDGAAIFKNLSDLPLWRSIYPMFRPKYDASALRKVVLSMVGTTRLRDCRRHVLVPAVSLTTGRPVIFTNTTTHHSGTTIADIALATSAAPIYFPTAQVGSDYYTDGGLAANAPDFLALHCAVGNLGIPRSHIRCLALGTTTRPMGRVLSKGSGLGVLGWLKRLYLVDLAMSCQEDLVTQAMRLELGDRYMRVDAVVSDSQARQLGLDSASRPVTDALKALAADAAKAALKSQAMMIFMSHDSNL